MTRVRQCVLLIAACLAAGCGSPVSGPFAPTSPALATPSAASGVCPIEGSTQTAPSNRLVDVTVTVGPTTNQISFMFGNRVSSPAGEPVTHLAQAAPPFSGGPSGALIDVAGTRFIELRFSGMVITDETGAPTFQGLRDQELELPALKQVTLYDESEGVVGWYIGFDGPGCVQLSTLKVGQGQVRLEIEHP